MRKPSTFPFPSKPSPDSRVLVIGHDPRLRESEALAQHAFFADFFFRPVPTRGSELAKYNLARAIYAYIGELTSYRFAARELLLTNLCNDHLPHAPKGKVVLIPRDHAEQGLAEISRIIQKADFDVIFSMSEQVNYWLHALDFCIPRPEFLQRAEPKARGLASEPPYYEPRVPKAFQLIAFRRHETVAGIPLYPIVHVRSWPFRGPFKDAYSKLYSACISDLKPDVAQQLT
jgi:hypothetical protein